MKVNPHVKKQQLDLKRIGITLGVLALLLLTIIIALSGEKQPSAGQAFFVDIDRISSEVVPLAEEETLIFRRLPAQASTVRFSTVVDLGNNQETFTLTLIKESADNYIFEINRSGNLVLRDRLDTAGDATSIYLNALDVIPDLEVRLESGQVSVSNLQFISPDLLKLMMFHHETGAHLGRVLRVNASQIFNGKLNTTSPLFPEVEFNIIPTLTGLANPFNGTLSVNDWERSAAEINRTFNVTFGPVNVANQPVSLLLNVTATIQGGRTSKYLVLAVNNRTLDVNTIGYPLMRVDFTDLDPQGMTARLNVTFRDTTDLQPFALPCRLPDNEAVLYANGRASGFLARDNIAKIYSYDPAANRALQSASAAPIGQITQLKQFEGYFVQLSRAENTSVIINNCEVEDPRLLGIRTVPSLVEESRQLTLTHQIKRGWNLVSIPGVVPTSLKEIAPSSARFELFGCSIGEICRRLDLNAALQPGRPYWIYSTSDFTVFIE